MKYTQIPISAFAEMQLNAGIIADDFTTSTGAYGEILGATTGGTNFSATPSYTDFGEDIDNCPKNTMELKRVEQWEVKMSGTFVNVTDNLAKMLVAAGTITGQTYALTSDTALVAGKKYYTRSGSEGSYVYTRVTTPSASSLASYYEQTVSTVKVTPRAVLERGDFHDIWWIGDYSDKNGNSNGGFVAIHLMNALNTGGFQIQSSDKAKGQFSYEFTGHYSISAQDTVPFEVYIRQGSDEPTT